MIAQMPVIGEEGAGGQAVVENNAPVCVCYIERVVRNLRPYILLQKKDSAYVSRS